MALAWLDSQKTCKIELQNLESKMREKIRVAFVIYSLLGGGVEIFIFGRGYSSQESLAEPEAHRFKPEADSCGQAFTRGQRSSFPS
jgi:hypothetical protein